MANIMSTDTKPNNAVERLDLDTAEEFLNHIRTSSTYWTPYGSHRCPWLFRGQSNVDDPLIPTLWRYLSNSSTATEWRGSSAPKLARRWKDLRERIVLKRSVASRSQHLPDDVRERFKDVMALIQIERDSVREFVDQADSIGIPLEQWPASHRIEIAPLNIEMGWKVGHFLSMKDPIPAGQQITWAFARHHAIDCRLLDWTRSATFASFFAARKVEDPSPVGSDRRICVWALRRQRYWVDKYGGELQYVTPARARTSFLFAQEGVLIFDPFVFLEYLNSGNWVPLDVTINEAISIQDTDPPLENPFMRCLTLPASQAHALRLALMAEGVSDAKLMPTLDNAAATAKWIAEHGE
ncbi:MAG: FRG domain-containing protein [Phycisphaerales bacterium]|nr:MAG: FRG domain-containing protein [Phycisphaerales bacterium]